MTKPLEVNIPSNIAEASAFDRLKFLMTLQFAYKNRKSADKENIELEPLLDYVAEINKILDCETHKKVRLLALETLHLIIDVILKYFSTSFMSSLKLSERLMLIAILVKRNCFPVFCLPARQPMLDLGLLEEKDSIEDYTSNKIDTLKQKTNKPVKTTMFVKASEVDEKVLTKSISELMDRTKLKLIAGIEFDDFTSLSLDEMQVVSLMMNDKDFTMVLKDDMIKLVKNEDSKGMTVSESRIFKPIRP